MSTPTLASSVRIRRAIPEDADACGSIAYEAFAAINNQHSFPPDLPSAEVATSFLRMLFSDSGHYAVIAESAGQIVGSNILDERSTIAGIGPLTVAPGRQNSSVGRQLMQAVLDRAGEQSFPGVRLVQSAFHNRSLSLYSKLGFDVREPISLMQGAPINEALNGATVRLATQDDFESANRLCNTIHGHSRVGELRDGIHHGTASVLERHGQITGYTSNLGFFGHTVGVSTEDVQALIAAASSFSGPGLLVPNRNARLFRWCLHHGLRIVYPMTLMSMGLYNEPAGAFLPSVLY